MNHKDRNDIRGAAAAKARHFTRAEPGLVSSAVATDATSPSTPMDNATYRLVDAQDRMEGLLMGLTNALTAVLDAGGDALARAEEKEQPSSPLVEAIRGYADRVHRQADQVQCLIIRLTL